MNIKYLNKYDTIDSIPCETGAGGGAEGSPAGNDRQGALSPVKTFQSGWSTFIEW